MSTHVAALAVVVAGLGAGLDLDRTVVALPAWRRLGVEPWAAFSREADLRNGLVLYPLIGVGSAILSIVSAATAPTAARRAASLAAMSAVAVLATTAKAAPNMLRIRSTDAHDGLRSAFDGFNRWHALRTVAQVVAFGASVTALQSASRS
jgi:hypothetical protein